jgi:glutathione S-transferase
MKLIIGNKNYSSWSLRAWLAAKQSGLPFEEILVPIAGDDWDERKRSIEDIAPSSGKVPVLWDGDVVVWDSLAILEFLADKVGRDRFWPKADDARAMARSMVAEMHSSYYALRRQCPVNIRRRIENHRIDDEARADVVRILTLLRRRHHLCADRLPVHDLRGAGAGFCRRLYAGGVGTRLAAGMGRGSRGRGLGDRAV